MSPALADGAAIDHFLIGTGKDIAPLAPAIRDAFRSRHIVVEPMSTGAAVRTYNILLGERRRVGALLDRGGVNRGGYAASPRIITDLILRSVRRTRLEGWPQAPRPVAILRDACFAGSSG